VAVCNTAEYDCRLIGLSSQGCGCLLFVQATLPQEGLLRCTKTSSCSFCGLRKGQDMMCVSTVWCPSARSPLPFPFVLRCPKYLCILHPLTSSWVMINAVGLAAVLSSHCGSFVRPVHPFSFTHGEKLSQFVRVVPTQRYAINCGLGHFEQQWVGAGGFTLFTNDIFTAMVQLISVRSTIMKLCKKEERSDEKEVS